MDSQKWYQSRTLWGIIVTFIAMILNKFGYTLGIEDQAGVVNILLEIAAVGGTAYAAYGRVAATKVIK